MESYLHVGKKDSKHSESSWETCGTYHSNRNVNANVYTLSYIVFFSSENKNLFKNLNTLNYHLY